MYKTRGLATGEGGEAVDIIRTSSRTPGRLLLLTLLAAIGFGLTYVPQALAVEYGCTASLGLRETYDDNVYFTGKSDFVHRASPSLALAAVTELTELELAASFDFTKYQENGDLDTVEQFYQGLAKWSLTPRLSLSFTGVYVVDYTFEFALRQQGVVTDRNQRQALSGKPVLTYGVGLRDTIEIAYEPYSANYDHPTDRDYKGQQVTLAWIHDLQNERTSLKLFSVQARPTMMRT